MAGVLASVATFALVGLDSSEVTVEVDIRRGLPVFTVVGLPDRAVREARDRVRSALTGAGCQDALCLVDGFRVPGLELEQRAVIGGDSRSAAIAAASVLAKVTRDRYMRRAAERHPEWDFHTNVGYSTPEHRAAIAANGISPLHRLSFASIAYQQLPLG